MSSGQKAAYDDECEWSSFCNEHFKDLLARPNWDVYSKEATLAYTGHREFGLTGQKLFKWVLLKQELADMEYAAKTQFKAVQEAKNLLLSLGYKITK